MYTDVTLYTIEILDPSTNETHTKTVGIKAKKDGEDIFVLPIDGDEEYEALLKMIS